VTQIIIKARQTKGQDNALLARQRGKTYNRSVPFFDLKPTSILALILPPSTLILKEIGEWEMVFSAYGLRESVLRFEF